MPARILVVGVERSGTSWVGGTLRSTPGAGFVGEPDHPELNPFAVRAVEGLGSHPVIARDEPGPAAYRKLWDAAFGAVPRYARGQGRISRAIFRSAERDDRLAVCHPEHPRVAPRLRIASALAVPKHVTGHMRTRVVKSVRVHFALDWLRANWNPTVVVCRRHPLDVVASALAVDIPPGLDWLAPAARAQAMERFGVAEPSTVDLLTCMAWRTGLLMSVLDEHVRRHPELHVADHENLCGAPVERMRELVTSIGLEWTQDSEDFVIERDRPGTGFQVSRVASEQPGKWRTRLSADDARTAARVLAQFPISDAYDLHV
ncbi:MAG: hypothetical protein WD271_16730 [Acidimicrobiia bacterium]